MFEDNIVKLIIAFLFFFGPAILRFIKKRKIDQLPDMEFFEEIAPTPPEEVPLPSVIPTAPVKAKPPRSMGQDRAPTQSETTQERHLLTMVDTLRARIDTLKNVCNYKRLTIVSQVVDSVCGAPLRTHESQLMEARDANIAMSLNAVSRHQKQIALIEKRIVFFEKLVEARSSQLSGKFNLLDSMALDLLTPYIVHTRRLDISMNRILGIVGVSGTLENRRDLQIVQVDEHVASTQSSWAQVSHSVAKAVWENIPGFSKRLTNELGLPESTMSLSYFIATGRLTLAGLVSGWLPWIFADTMATLQLGPGYGAYLQLEEKRRRGDAAAMQTSINERGVATPPPLYVRIYTSSIVLRAMGFQKESETLLSLWNTIIGSSDGVILQTDKFSDIVLPAADLEEDLNHLMNSLLSKPLSSFGGYPLPQIPGLLCTEEVGATMAQISSALISGVTLDCSTRELLGAQGIAIASASHLQSAIEKAAIKGFVDGLQRSSAAELSDGGRVLGLEDGMKSLGFVARSILVSSAISKTRGGCVARMRNGN